jgi:hypothetical protein
VDDGELGRHWDAAAGALDEDLTIGELLEAQELWAAAVAAEVAATPEISCDGAVFAPMAVRGGWEFVVNRAWVHVASEAGDLLAATRAAWDRWWAVDEAGLEHPEALGEIDPFGQPQRAGEGLVLAYDAREVESPLPLQLARCLRILVAELVAHGCLAARITDAQGAG